MSLSVEDKAVLWDIMVRALDEKRVKVFVTDELGGYRDNEVYEPEDLERCMKDPDLFA